MVATTTDMNLKPKQYAQPTTGTSTGTHYGEYRYLTICTDTLNMKVTEQLRQDLTLLSILESE